MSPYRLVWLEIAEQQYRGLSAELRELIDARLAHLLEDPTTQAAGINTRSRVRDAGQAVSGPRRARDDSESASLTSAPSCLAPVREGRPINRLIVGARPDGARGDAVEPAGHPAAR
jgi:hypothetical protein